jgi:hypothetical protein
MTEKLKDNDERLHCRLWKLRGMSDSEQPRKSGKSFTSDMRLVSHVIDDRRLRPYRSRFARIYSSTPYPMVPMVAFYQGETRPRKSPASPEVVGDCQWLRFCLPR